MNNLDLWLAKKQFRFGSKERKKLYQKLASLIGNGVRLDVALADLENRYRARQKNSPFAVGLKDWRQGMLSAKSFSEVLGDWIPDDEKMILSAGEENLEDALVTIVDVMDAKTEINSIMFVGFLMPVISFILTVAIMLFFSYTLIPRFLNVAPEGMVFTGLPYAVEVVTDFVRNWLGLILVVLFLLMTGVVASLSRWTGKNRILFDNVFPWNIYRVQQGLGWVYSLAALTQQGYKIYDSLVALSSKANPWMKQRINDLIKRLKESDDFGVALLKSKYKFPDKDLIDDISIYSQSGGFDHALKVVAKEWSKEAKENLKRNFKIFGYLSLLVTLLILAFLALGMIGITPQITTYMKTNI